MSRIKSKNTKPELRLRSFLHNLGFRFRVNRKDLPGKPDVVLTKYKTVIFVHGCFWHRHPNCKSASTPKSNTDFWEKKFAANVKRDRNNKEDLERMGWRVIVVWECQIRKQEDLENLVKNRIAPLLKSDFISSVAEKRPKYNN